MDEVTREIATRMLRIKQIEQFGVTTPEIMDAVLRGNELTIILVDGRKLKFDTDEQPNLPKPQAGAAAARKSSEPFAYIERAVEEEVKAIQAETKPKKGKTKS
jgi:hypothetical protein